MIVLCLCGLLHRFLAEDPKLLFKKVNAYHTTLVYEYTLVLLTLKGKKDRRKDMFNIVNIGPATLIFFFIMRSRALKYLRNILQYHAKKLQERRNVL